MALPPPAAPVQPDLIELIAHESREEFELSAGQPTPGGVRRSSVTYAALYDYYAEKYGDPVGALFRMMQDNEGSDPKIALQAALTLIRFRYPQLRATEVETAPQPMRLVIDMRPTPDESRD